MRITCLHTALLQPIGNLAPRLGIPTYLVFAVNSVLDSVCMNLQGLLARIGTCLLLKSICFQKEGPSVPDSKNGDEPEVQPPLERLQPQRGQHLQGPPLQTGQSGAGIQKKNGEQIFRHFQIKTKLKSEISGQ